MSGLPPISEPTESSRAEIGSHVLLLLHYGVRRLVRIRGSQASAFPFTAPPGPQGGDTLHAESAYPADRPPDRQAAAPAVFVHTGGLFWVGGNSVRIPRHGAGAAFASTGAAGAPSSILFVAKCLDG